MGDPSVLDFGERVLGLSYDALDEQVSVCQYCQDQIEWPKSTGTYYCGYIDDRKFLVRLICRRDLKTYTHDEVYELYRRGSLKEEIETLVAIDIMLNGREA